MVHDPLCVTPYKQQATCASCVLVARVRADERERIVAELDGPAQESEAMYAHAEAVAARLVEVICDLDWQLGDDRVICDALIVQLQHERAEAAALRERLSDTALDIAEYRRAWLADLRAKVEALRDQSLEAFRSRPHQQHMGTMASTLERVLALFEEAERA